MAATMTATTRIGDDRITFADVTAPLLPDDFLSRYWRREAVLLRAAERDFARFCDWNAVNAILNAGDFAFPAIKVSRPDSPVPSESFTTSIGVRPISNPPPPPNLSPDHPHSRLPPTY